MGDDMAKGKVRAKTNPKTQTTVVPDKASTKAGCKPGQSKKKGKRK